MAAKERARTAPKAAAPARFSGRKIQARKSGIHGKGVFALQDIAEGETLIEYVGEVISWKEALRRHPHDPKDPNHTFYFHIDDGRVIDAKHGGNSSRWINHSCDPNCEAEVDESGRVFIRSLRPIAAGEELFYDYGLTQRGADLLADDTSDNVGRPRSCITDHKLDRFVWEVLCASSE